MTALLVAAATFDGKILQRRGLFGVVVDHRQNRFEGSVDDFFLGRLRVNGTHALQQRAGIDSGLDILL